MVRFGNDGNGLHDGSVVFCFFRGYLGDFMCDKPKCFGQRTVSLFAQFRILDYVHAIFFYK
jgi:hypothetical protein